MAKAITDEADVSRGTTTRSTYAAYREGRLVFVHGSDGAPTPLQELVHDSFRALVLNPQFVCVGAKSAIHRGTYRMGMYGELGSGTSSVELARDLGAFVDEHRHTVPMFTSFIAAFAGPIVPTENEFEALLWRQLQRLHDIETPKYAWDASVSSDPADPGFSFSFAGKAFFVVGLHPASSRWSRRFAWPTLIFNRHDQFDRLRHDGRYGSMRRTIRAREEILQGRANPMLSDFGDRSEARQYSGRAVEDDWVCPFQPRTTSE